MLFGNIFDDLYFSSYKLSGVRGAELHRGSGSYPAAPGSNPGSVEIFFRSAEILSLLFSSWTVELSNPASAYARDFSNAVSGEGLRLEQQKVFQESR